MKRCGKSAPASRATSAARQPPPGARSSVGGPVRSISPGRPHRWMVTTSATVRGPRDRTPPTAGSPSSTPRIEARRDARRYAGSSLQANRRGWTMSEFASRALSEEASARDDGGTRPEIVTLTDPRALEVGLTGSKAAALARAAVAGIDTLPGVVLTTGFTAAVDATRPGAGSPAAATRLRARRGRPTAPRRPQLVGAGGHRRVFDGRSVRLDHRHRHASRPSWTPSRRSSTPARERACRALRSPCSSSR